ncbi:hypothetical protein EIP91_010764 [Steccherinum ochraceum]|uniref:BTB domain-containing protein n=1 Tax=Steccherinum ochraceum TaxID=92696 RepID=A0A4V2MUW7_9APHY|nr:hypothetical protein EIP91_010764 [Steccherinum ochraceum]
MAEQASATSLPWTKSTEVWFDDGNIILVAGGEGFRIFRGILAQQSPIFADMLKVPQPTATSGEIMYDGCPVVFMPDTALETKHFMKALHDIGSMESFSPPNSLDPATIYAIDDIIRLSMKYEVTRLVAVMCNALSQCFPASYDDFCKAYVTLQKMPAGESFMLATTLRASGSAGRKLLPPVLLLCAHQELSQILDGVAYTHRDGWSELDVQTKRAVLLARSKLHNMALGPRKATPAP